MCAVRLACLAAHLVAFGHSSVWADGGAVCVSEAAGPFTVTVFVSPVPLRAGPIDVSVLVQDGGGREPVLDADVSIDLRARSADAADIRAAATREQATNKLLYAALVDLPTAGEWDLEATVQRAGVSAAVSCTVRAHPPRPALLAFWPYLALPPFAIAAFALHQWLQCRRRPSG